MEYLINLSILLCIYSILGLSLNMVVGMTGLLSLAQAAFYGIGAYACALGMTALGMNFFTSILLGMVVNAVLAFVVGKILSQFKGDYYAIVSAGLSIIVFSVLLNWKGVTNGPIGIFGIPKPEIASFAFSSSTSFLSLSLGLAALVFVLFKWLDKSSFGRALKAIREDEELAQVMGYKTRSYKSIIFVLSAMLSGMAGALFASYIAFIDPFTFTLHEGIFLFTIIILGGLSDAWGSVLGAVILLSLPEALRFLGLSYEHSAQIQKMIYGGALVAIIAFRPKGILGKYKM
jgi:branched-chain amino acid transport system permease protein